MHYKILGRTGLNVSVAGLGCGGHSRLDFPQTSSGEWAKQNNVIVRDGDRMVLKQVPLAQMPEDLQKIVMEESQWGEKHYCTLSMIPMFS